MIRYEPLGTKALYEGWWQATAEAYRQDELFHSQHSGRHVLLVKYQTR